MQYLQRKQIDTSKWDQCIDKASNGLIYAYAFYLDYMTADWDGIVLGDYEAVMPLPKRTKFGITYIYQPAFIASLGVFGSELTPELVGQFIAAIPASFKLVDLRLNYGNNFAHSNGVVRQHNNYVLSLQPDYESLFKQYRENIRRNVKKSEQLGVLYQTDIPVADVIALARQQLQSITEVTTADYDSFARLYEMLKQQRRAIACGVYTPANELVASCVYFFDKRRAYYILVGNHPNGRTIGASHYLIDRFIRDHAGTPLLLDFEGSDIRNLAFFYSSFGSTVELYPAIWINHLPWWIRLLKGKKFKA